MLSLQVMSRSGHWCLFRPFQEYREKTRKDKLYANKTHGVYQHSMLVHTVPHCLLMRWEVVLCQFHRAFRHEKDPRVSMPKTGGGE
jgi:hypothetical protein